MPDCLTCRQRKVKCDRRPDRCYRCEKLGLPCRWHANDSAHPNLFGASQRLSSKEQQEQSERSVQLTQAGYKRFRTSIACAECRKRKSKCDSQQPSCSLCIRRNTVCIYDSPRNRERRTRKLGSIGFPTPDDVTTSSNISPEFLDNVQETDRDDGMLPSNISLAGTSPNSMHQSEATLDREKTSLDQGNGERLNVYPPIKSPPLPTGQSPPLPIGQDLLPYLDAFLESVHPVCCNNFLHPGILGEGIHRAPRLLVLAICGSSSKFLGGLEHRERGQRWIALAKSLICQDLNIATTLTISAIQFIIMHDMHEGNFTSASNFVAISTRMALSLSLTNGPSPETSDVSFLAQECRSRLVWSCFVADQLFSYEHTRMDAQSVADLPLPCNLWSFTQGSHCNTLRLSQVCETTADIVVRQSTNPCAYLIKILIIRRKILDFLQTYRGAVGVASWFDETRFNSLLEELNAWRRNLPANFAFEGKHMYTFRVSRHLDMFLMIHAYFHQCAYELYGAWMPNHAGALSHGFEFAIAPELVQNYKERCLEHAQGISRLIEKVLQLDPKHLFRDAWFSICILDSTRIQLAAWHHHMLTFPGKDEIAHFLKINLLALKNTKDILIVANLIDHECQREIRAGGLDSLLESEQDGDDDANSQVTMDAMRHTHGNNSSPLFKRYPFLGPVVSDSFHDIESWTELFEAKNFAHPPAPPQQTKDRNVQLLQPPDNVMEILYPLGNLQHWDATTYDWQITPGILEDLGTGLEAA